MSQLYEVIYSASVTYDTVACAHQQAIQLFKIRSRDVMETTFHESSNWSIAGNFNVGAFRCKV